MPGSRNQLRALPKTKGTFDPSSSNYLQAKGADALDLVDVSTLAGMSRHARRLRKSQSARVDEEEL